MMWDHSLFVPSGMWCWLSFDSLLRCWVLALLRFPWVDCYLRCEVDSNTWVLWLHSCQHMEHLWTLSQECIKVSSLSLTLVGSLLTALGATMHHGGTYLLVQLGIEGEWFHILVAAGFHIIGIWSILQFWWFSEPATTISNSEQHFIHFIYCFQCDPPSAQTALMYRSHGALGSLYSDGPPLHNLGLPLTVRNIGEGTANTSFLHGCHILQYCSKYCMKITSLYVVKRDNELGMETGRQR